MPPTIKDIARRAGKSVGTVSRALHDYDDISAETKSQIRQIAAEMGYRPNSQALRLQKQRSDTLGLILPTFGPRFSDPFFSEFIAGIGNKAAESNYDLLVATHAPGEKELEAYRHNVEAHRVDGFILVRTRRQDARIEYLQKTGVPFVAFGRVEADNRFPYVDEDGDHGMALIIEHLAQLGHRRLAFITAPADLNLNRERLAGIQRKMAELEIPFDPSRLVEGDLTQRGGHQQAHKLLDQDPPPSAIVA
ncbi:MAG TPA: LacI family DNA-binding transcriptional regulator, partial [Anaerolineales bacterium]|nr:LacI family DNA-binding transcriptional regulator [Anaerolineales bacterium]